MLRAARLTLCIALGTLAGCWHEAFHTSVENNTKHTVYATIYFEDRSIAPGHGNIEPGNSVSLTQKVEDISYIGYQSGEHHCRLDKTQIAKIARVGERGVSSILLGDCGPAPAL